MSLLLSELILRHEGVVRRSASQEGAAGAAPEVGEFMTEVQLLELLSDLVLHLPACATSIHRYGEYMYAVPGTRYTLCKFGVAYHTTIYNALRSGNTKVMVLISISCLFFLFYV